MALTYELKHIIKSNHSLDSLKSSGDKTCWSIWTEISQQTLDGLQIKFSLRAITMVVDSA